MFDELWSEINDSQGEIYDVIDFKEEWEKEEKFDVESYINGNTDYWYLVGEQLVSQTGQPLRSSWWIGTSNLKVFFRSSVSPWTTKSWNLCHAYSMNKTLLSSPQTLQDLQDFMFDTMASAEMAVDWFCDRFNVNADDDVIDFVLDAHDSFFGNW